MYVRLAFSVAAHLDPEILVVDEVLAVGDAQFQNKCLGRMHEVANEGRTVLFVSHNMGVLRRLCTRGIVLRQGKCIYDVMMSAARFLMLLTMVRCQSAEWSGPASITDKAVGFTLITASTVDVERLIRSRQSSRGKLTLNMKLPQSHSIQIAFRLNGEDGSTVFTSAECDKESLIL